MRSTATHGSLQSNTLESGAPAARGETAPAPLEVYRPSLMSIMLHDQRLVAALFLTPALAILCFVVVYPFFNAIWMSLTNKIAGAPGTFIGIANYVELVNDRYFFQILYQTVLYTCVGVAIKFVIGLTMATVLSQDRPLNFLYKTILFVPWAVPPVVAALNWRWIYDDFSGMLNNILIKVFGFTEPVSWLGDPSLALWSVLAVVVWTGTPFYTMSFLAGLKAIPKELYEAARIDGASRWNEFWNITIPSMRNVFLIVVMLSSIWTSTQIVFVLLLTNGGPANTSQILPNLAFKYALAGGRLGMGSAVNMVFFPILALLIVLLSRKMLQERGQ